MLSRAHAEMSSYLSTHAWCMFRKEPTGGVPVQQHLVRRDETDLSITTQLESPALGTGRGYTSRPTAHPLIYRCGFWTHGFEREKEKDSVVRDQETQREGAAPVSFKGGPPER
jgi:hypothetical protein